MNFEYQIINDQLYLAPIKACPDFEFAGLGFTRGNSQAQKSLCEVIKDLDPPIALNLLQVEAGRFPNSKAYDQLKEREPSFVISPQEELIFFGGSFNPWHRGHKACLELMGTRKIIVLPDRNPFKDLIELSPVDIYCELFEHLELDRHYLNPEFILKEDKNPTYAWIKSTHQRFPQVKLSLLMGMDSLDSIDRWFEADKLLKTINVIYAASRKEDIGKRVEIHHRLTPYSNLRLVFLGHHPFEDESSTRLRGGK